MKTTPVMPTPGQLSDELRFVIKSSLADLEAFKGNLFIAMRGELPRSLIVISSGSGDGRTVITGCLGHALSKSQKVLLVDSCLENPRLHELFNLSRTPGLTDYLSEQASLEEVVQSTELPYLQVITAGNPIKEATNILDGRRYSDLILQARESWDCVICDSPPYLGPSDSPFLARHFECALMIINCHRTRLQIAHLVVERFTAAQGRLIGVILNRRHYYIPSWFYRYL